MLPCGQAARACLAARATLQRIAWATMHAHVHAHSGGAPRRTPLAGSAVVRTGRLWPGWRRCTNPRHTQVGGAGLCGGRPAAMPAAAPEGVTASQVAALEPRPVMSLFASLTQIPRPSKQEAR